MKSLPFYIPEAWKRYSSWAEPPRIIGHCREYPPPPLPLGQRYPCSHVTSVACTVISKTWGSVPLGWSKSGSVFQDHSDHDISKELTNPLWSWIHRFLWCTMIRVIRDLGSLILNQIISEERTPSHNKKNCSCIKYITLWPCSWSSSPMKLPLPSLRKHWW